MVIKIDRTIWVVSKKVVIDFYPLYTDFFENCNMLDYI